MNEKKKTRGQGTVYQRGRIWWLCFYRDGRPHFESSRSENETVARDLLKIRVGRAAAGEPVLPRADRVRYDEAAKDLQEHYQTTGSRDLEEAGYRLAHLNTFFSGRKLASLGPADATKYAVARQAEGASNRTVNLELSVLGKMLKLAYENGNLFRVPVIRKLKEAPPRAGFFEDPAFEAVRRRLRTDLQVAVSLAHVFGWRMQSEVLSLERRQLDFTAGTLRLDAGETKNDEGRVVYLTPDVKSLLAAQVARVQALERKTGRIIPFLFPHLTGRRAGARIKDFRKAWVTACTRAGSPGMLRHDLRRTAVRNLVNAGVVERVAMTVTGHKTRAVFDRYHIVSPGDLQDAARKLAEANLDKTLTIRPGALDARRVNP